MADDVKAAATETPPVVTPKPDDSINKLKAELSRKLGNFETMLTELKKSNETLASRVPAPKPAPVEDLGELLYKDPTAAVSRIKDQVRGEINQEMQQQSSTATRIQRTMFEISQDYPEMSNVNSDLFKKADEIYRSFPQEERTPLAMKLAARDAALELGVAPVSKRQNSDDFTLSNSNGPKEPTKRQKEGDLSEATKTFAELVGLDIKDPKVLERLKGHNGRKSWNKFQ